MSKPDTSKRLALLDVGKTTFPYQGSEYTIKDAPADVFDAWIRQYVEEISGVNLEEWEIHHRWNVINEVLKAGILELENGMLSEAFSSDPASEYTSETEGTVDAQPALQDDPHPLTPCKEEQQDRLPVRPYPPDQEEQLL